MVGEPMTAVNEKRETSLPALDKKQYLVSIIQH